VHAPSRSTSAVHGVGSAESDLGKADPSRYRDVRVALEGALHAGRLRARRHCRLCSHSNREEVLREETTYGTRGREGDKPRSGGGYSDLCAGAQRPPWSAQGLPLAAQLLVALCHYPPPTCGLQTEARWAAAAKKEQPNQDPAKTGPQGAVSVTSKRFGGLSGGISHKSCSREACAGGAEEPWACRVMQGRGKG